MKKVEEKDEMRPEYDLKTLKVRRVGHERKGFGDLVRLDPEVMQVFPDAKAVNDALHALIAIARRSSVSAL
ncbi:hypothetical protein VU05_01045 [Desulfobulbus sp. F1]|jgi:hypothetical protein|nr:hypothetical protein [Desulfobulbus sp. F1]